MIENYACAILSARDMSEKQRYASMAAELCILRYPMCKATLIEYINSQLDSLGITSITDFKNLADLIEKITTRLIEQGQGILYSGKSTRELREIRQLASRILVVSVLATLDTLGIKCPGIKPT